MNLVIFCAIVSLPASLAFVVKFYDVDLGQNNAINEGNPLLVCNQRSFMYERGDNFTMNLKINNIRAPAVTSGVIIVKKYTGSRSDVFSNHLFVKEIFITESNLTNDRIVIDVELSSGNECQRETIYEGTRRDEVPKPLETMHKTTTNDICFNEKKCYAIAYAANTCSRRRRDTKPQECQIINNSNPLVTTVAQLDKRDLLTLMSQITGSQSKTITPQEDTSDALTSNSTVTIVSSSIAAVTLVSLIILSIRHFSWKKYNSPGLQQIVPTNENRYYENILFGPDCLQEINQTRQRPSDRPPSLSELHENLYEEINNYLNHESVLTVRRRSS